MAPKEQLREKFAQIIACDFYPDMQPTPVCYDTADALLAAVEETFSNPIHITITPSDEQIQELSEAFKVQAHSIVAYGCTCGATPNSQSQQYEGT